MYAVYALSAVYAVYAVYAIYTVYAVYAVYAINTVYTVYAVYAVYVVYAVHAGYAVYAVHGIYIWEWEWSWEWSWSWSIVTQNYTSYAVLLILNAYPCVQKRINAYHNVHETALPVLARSGGTLKLPRRISLERRFGVKKVTYFFRLPIGQKMCFFGLEKRVIWGL